MMKKTYEATIEDAVEAQIRFCELIGTARNYKWAGLLVGPVVGGVALLLLTYIPWNSFDGPARLIISGGVAVVCVSTWLLRHTTYLRKHIRRTLVKARGTDQPIPTECEIDDSGLALRMCGREVRFSWNNVQSISYRNDLIELIMAPTAVVVIPKRVFGDPAELQEWTKFIESHIGPKNL
jgi:hypothetical protein